MAVSPGYSDSEENFSPTTRKVFCFVIGLPALLLGALGWLLALGSLILVCMSRHDEKQLAKALPIPGTDAVAAQGRLTAVTGPLRASGLVGDGVFLKPTFVFLRMKVFEYRTSSYTHDEHDEYGRVTSSTNRDITEWVELVSDGRSSWAKDLKVDGLGVDLEKNYPAYDEGIQVADLQLDSSLLLTGSPGWTIDGACLVHRTKKHCFAGIREGETVTVFGQLAGERVVPMQDTTQLLVMQLGDRDTAARHFAREQAHRRVLMRIAACGFSWLSLLVVFFGIRLFRGVYERVPDYPRLCGSDWLSVVAMCATLVSVWPVAVITAFSTNPAWCCLGVLGLIAFMVGLPRRRSSLATAVGLAQSRWKA